MEAKDANPVIKTLLHFFDLYFPMSGDEPLW